MWRSVPSALLIFALLVEHVEAGEAQRARSFADLPTTHQAFEAVRFLTERSIISGYPDGTFRPDQPIKRAEALKLIIAPILAGAPTETSSPFDDIALGAWYLPYAEHARKAGVIDGPPKRQHFEGERPVLKAEFLKILLLAHGVKVESLEERLLPLAPDSADPSQWFHPYLAHGVMRGMIAENADLLLRPGQVLTRADASRILHAFLAYNENLRTQFLLTYAEEEMALTLRLMSERKAEHAIYAATRALLAAKGARLTEPQSEITQAALELARSFVELGNGYLKGSKGSFAEAITHAKSAWSHAQEAAAKNPVLLKLATEVQSISHTLAASARTFVPSP